MRRFALILLGCLALGSLPLVIATRTPPRAAALAAHPNIILIVTDDQTMDTMAALPELERVDSWWTFNNAFINSPLCCPSRASILTGKFAHHTGIERNIQAVDFNDMQTVATWLQATGYRTGIFGKYLNSYPWTKTGPGNPPTPYRPPGWNKVAIFGSDPEYVPHQDATEPAECAAQTPCYVLNESIGLPTQTDSMLRKKVYDGETTLSWSPPVDTNSDYSTDVLKELAKKFISNNSSAPFFLYFAPPAPHWPFWPSSDHDMDEPGHSAADIDAVMPRLESRPNFNKDIGPQGPPSKGPWWEVNRCQTTVEPHYTAQCEEQNDDPPRGGAFTGSYVPAAGCPPPELQVHQSPSVHEQQCQHYNAWRTLRSVDDALREMRLATEARVNGNKWDNTVVIFMTDNGLSMGSHNWNAKTCIYEECIRTPLRIRYPGNFGTGSNNVLVSNVDIAPTIVDIAGVTNQTMLFDGRSLKPWLEDSSVPDWREALLVQSRGWTTRECSDPPEFSGVRSWHWVYGEFAPGADGDEVACTIPPSIPPGLSPAGATDFFGELYNLSEAGAAPDPHQLTNLYNSPQGSVAKLRQAKLDACLDYLNARAAKQWPTPPDEQSGDGQTCDLGP